MIHPSTNIRYEPTRTPQRGDDWRDDAACRGMEPEQFFIPGDNWTGTKAARAQAEACAAICQGCAVIRECLASAIEVGDRHAFRGGMTPGQRDGMRRKARKTRAKENAA